MVEQLRRQLSELGVAPRAFEHREHEASGTNLRRSDNGRGDRQQLVDGCRLDHRRGPVAIEDRDRFVVAGNEHVDRRFQQARLRAEQQLDSRHSNTCPGGDLADRRRRIAAFQEHLSRRFDDPLACQARLRLAAI